MEEITGKEVSYPREGGRGGEGEGREGKGLIVYRRPNLMKEAFLFSGTESISSYSRGEDLFPNRMNDAFLLARGICPPSSSFSSFTNCIRKSETRRAEYGS